MIFGLAGCSTILNGTTQSINVATSSLDIENVIIESSGIHYRETLPTTLHIDSIDKNYPITISTTGNCINPNKIKLRKQIAHTYWLNAFNGFGFFIDYATGSMWQYQDEVRFDVRRKDYCQEKTTS